MFHETSTRLRLPTGVAAAGGIVAVIAAFTSAAVADVTGILAASAAAIGALVAFRQRQKILHVYEEQMRTKRSELVKAIEAHLQQAIGLFYQEVAAAFQPLAAFCAAQRRTYEPLLERAEELECVFDGLKSRLG
jgi:acyl-CoA reductase-like NAD-dependent aldehyde dehydrogenase